MSSDAVSMDDESTDHEDLFRSWRARAREDPEAAAGLLRDFAAGRAASLGPHARQLTAPLSAVLPLAAGDRALRHAVASPVPPPGLARSAALLAATEAVALLGSRAIHSLTAELSVVSAVTPSLAYTLVGSALAELGSDEPVGEGPDAGLLTAQFPRLVRGFAAGTVDRTGLAEVVDLRGPLRALDVRALSASSRRGCSLVQQLPALLVRLEEDGAPAALVGPAQELVAAADQLHWRLAEAQPADTLLGHAYELVYAGAASLSLWTRSGALWVRAALGELLGPLLGADPAPDTRALLVAELYDRRRNGLPLTPFGA